MDNPALITPGIDHRLLRPKLDPDTVECLKWQTMFAQEWRAVAQMELQEQEQNLLLRLVLPMLVKRLMELRLIQGIARVYRSVTPAFLQKFVSSSAGALQTVLTTCNSNCNGMCHRKTLCLVPLRYCS